MTGERWRLVGRQNDGQEHVNSIVMNEEEARESLLIEAAIHDRFGWTVTVGLNEDDEPDVVVARKRSRRGFDIIRAITVRAFGPLDDEGSR